jgi:DNA-binding PadR family transcriptional regulator
MSGQHCAYWLARQGADLRKQRVALSGVFAVHGFLYASWAVRVPAVKQQTSALCRRIGSRKVTVASCALLSLTLVLPTLAHSAVDLGLGLLVFGAIYGCLNVAMNSVAVALVAALRRPVMPSLHAAWSFGGLAGAGLGGLLADTNGVAFASTIGYCGFLLGPPAIGFLASEFGLRAGLVTLSFLGLAAAVIAYADSGRTRRVRRALPGSGALVTRTSLTAEPVQSILSMQYSVCPVGGPLSVRHSLLALLNRGPMHGYGLKTEFEAATADVWPLNVGQVYTTLARLERDRLVTAEADSDGQKVYGITEAGRDELRRWFETPIEREAMPRQELTIKLVFALRSGAANVAAVVRRQRVATVRSLQDVTRLKAAAESEGDTAWLLMLEALVFQAEAEVRWLDLCEARLSGPDAAPGRRVNAAVPQPIAPKHGVQERKVERSG